MSAIAKALEVYKRETCGSTFESDLEAHFAHGMVFSRPDFFVMLRPVCSTAPTSEIINPWHVFHDGYDCWHIYLFAGNMARAWDFLPFALPLVSFEKRNSLRFYRLDAFRHRITLL